MTTLLRRALPSALVAVVVLTLAACGAASSPTPSVASPTDEPSSPSASAPSTPAATDADPGTSDEPSMPEIDLEAAAEALEGIDSYKLSIVTEGAASSTIEAVIVRSPEPAQHFTSTTGGVTTEIIIVGDQAWAGAAGVYSPIPLATVSGMTSAFDPALMIGGIGQPGLASALQAVGEEDRNGVPTTHYRLDENSPGAGLASFPPGAAFDLWIADEGYLVALEATGLAGQLTMLRIDVTDINSPENVVEAPA